MFARHGARAARSAFRSSARFTHSASNVFTTNAQSTKPTFFGRGARQATGSFAFGATAFDSAGSNMPFGGFRQNAKLHNSPPNAAHAAAAGAAADGAVAGAGTGAASSGTPGAPGSTGIAVGDAVDATDEDFGKIVAYAAAHDIPLLVQFHADWCRPCKVLAPLVQDVITTDKTAALVRVDIEKAQETVRAYKVMALPTLVVIVDGQAKNQTIGSQTKDKVRQFLTATLGTQ